MPKSSGLMGAEKGPRCLPQRLQNRLQVPCGVLQYQLIACNLPDGSRSRQHLPHRWNKVGNLGPFGGDNNGNRLGFAALRQICPAHARDERWIERFVGPNDVKSAFATKKEEFLLRQRFVEYVDNLTVRHQR